MSEQTSIKSYNNPDRASDYNKKKGFDPRRKDELLNVTLSLLIDLTPQEASILELGAGTGLFTKKIINTGHFKEIFVTDGAEAMLEIARNELSSTSTELLFDTLDFTQPFWSKKFPDNKIGAVSSSMALHHAENKKTLFKEVFDVLIPGGVFVFADHMAGTSPLIDKLISTKRARLKLSFFKEDINDKHKIERFIQEDNKKQDAEGNKCESIDNYLQYLREAEFEDVDCIWRDYWLAVFVAKKR